MLKSGLDWARARVGRRAARAKRAERVRVMVGS